MNHLNIVDMGNASEDLRKERDEAIVKCERLSELNNKLTEDFNTLALDRRRWQDRAENAQAGLRSWFTEINKKITTDLTALALDWQERAEKLSIALAAEKAINKDLKIELDEARADIEASISDFKVAGGKLSEAQDALLELRAAFVQAWGFEPGPENTLYRPTLDKVDAALGSVNADAPAPFSEASQNYAERDPSVMAD